MYRLKDIIGSPFAKYYLGMKSFKDYIHEPPGAGYWGTHELRQRYVADTPGQVDPLAGNNTPTPQIYDDKSTQMQPQQPKRKQQKKPKVP
jgi:hypothetical protein